jgi:hypothetical protein
MQGKALVVNPAVSHPSATPSIVVGRERGHSEKARKCRAFEIEKFDVDPNPNQQPSATMRTKWYPLCLRDEPNMSISSHDSFASAHRGRKSRVASHPRDKRIQF